MVWRWIALAACGAASLGAVLYVNDGFGVLESRNYLDPEPQVIVEANDPCDKLAFLTLEANLVQSPNELRLIAEQVHPQPSGCEIEPQVKISYRLPSPLLPLGYHLVDDPEELEGEFPNVVRIAKAARTEETAIFPLGSWNSGFGRLRVKMIAMVQTGSCNRATSQGNSSSAPECEFPVSVRVKSPSHRYDVTSAIPSTVDIGDDVATVYSWRSRPTAPTNPRPGAIASSELNLASKHLNAIANVTTIIGSSVFGAVISILVSLLSPPTVALASGTEEPTPEARPSPQTIAASAQPQIPAPVPPIDAVAPSGQSAAEQTQAVQTTQSDSITPVQAEAAAKANNVPKPSAQRSPPA